MYIYYLYNLKTLEKKELRGRNLSDMWERNKNSDTPLNPKEWIVEWSSWTFDF